MHSPKFAPSVKHIKPAAHDEVVTSAEEQVVLLVPDTVFMSHTFCEVEYVVEQTSGPVVAAAGAAVVCLATRGAAGGVGAMAETTVAAARRPKSTEQRMFRDGRCDEEIDNSSTCVCRGRRDPME
jgi:hypothetical protein